MKKKDKEMLFYLKMNYLLDQWKEAIDIAEKKELSYEAFLSRIIQKEYEFKCESARKSRIGRATIPNEYVLETYPFAGQPHLNKKRLLQRHDSLDYLENNRNIVFIGPSGTGKTGLGSSILRHSINNGYTGKFVRFDVLMEELLNSIADQSSKKIIKRYSGYQCLLIDDLSFVEANKAEIGLFYTLIQKRYENSCTIITTPLGFSGWNKIFDNKQLTDALIGRLTDKGHVINLKNCQSIRTTPEIDQEGAMKSIKEDVLYLISSEEILFLYDFIKHETKEVSEKYLDQIICTKTYTFDNDGEKGVIYFDQ